MPTIKIDITKFSKRKMTRKQTALTKQKSTTQTNTQDEKKQTDQEKKKKKTNAKIGRNRATSRKKRNAPTSPAKVKGQKMMQFWTLRGISSRGGIRM